MARSVLTFLVGCALIASPLFAQAADRPTDLDGQWQRSSGNSRLAFTPCDGGLCGTIVWIRPGVETPAHVGQKVFFNLVPDGAAKWRGKAFNPEDGKTYTGEVSRDGDILTTKGCVLGGLICKSETWTHMPG